MPTVVILMKLNA